MDLLVVADVHGCFYTFRKLLNEHWDKANDLLIQVGDLVNKGPHSVLCLKYWMKLEKDFPERVIMIKGNHEIKLLRSLGKSSIFNRESRVKRSMKQENLSQKKTGKWLEKLPLKWENEHILITHAGIGKKALDPYDEDATDGVLHNKGPLKNVEKVQIKGHSIVEGNKPVFNPSENAWYIDTGAWTKKYLCALRFSPEGEMKEVIRVPTQPEDQKRKSYFY